MRALYVPVPIYREMLAMITKSLAKLGTDEAARRNLSIKLVHYAAGRASEASYITWEDSSWDEHFQGLFCVVPMTKTSKAKYVALVAGAHRHLDVFLDLADHFVLREPLVYDPRIADWLLPHLQQGQTKTAGQTIGGYMKDLLPGTVRALDTRALHTRAVNTRARTRTHARYWICVISVGWRKGLPVRRHCRAPVGRHRRRRVRMCNHTGFCRLGPWPCFGRLPHLATALHATALQF